MTESAADSGYAGWKSLADGTSDFNVWSFIIRQALGKVNTATLVEVVAISGGGVAPVGFVDVRPLVNQVDAAGIATEHGTIFGLPYFRLQGGANAIILDPKVGDVGLAVFADRDISSVKSNRAGPANPGSNRRFSFADGLYVGGVLNGTPSCYVYVTDESITITPDAGTTSIVLTPGSIAMNAAAVSITGTATTVVNGGELTLHGTTRLASDAGGTGTIIEPAAITGHTLGVPSTNAAPTPPGPL